MDGKEQCTYRHGYPQHSEAVLKRADMIIKMCSAGVHTSRLCILKQQQSGKLQIIFC